MTLQSGSSTVEADSAAGEPYEFSDDVRGSRLDGNDLESMVRSASRGGGESKTPKGEASRQPQGENDDEFNPYDTLRHDAPPDTDGDELEKALRQSENNPELDQQPAAEERKPEDEQQPEGSTWEKPSLDIAAEFEELDLGHLKDKYATPKEAFRGVVEAARLVGQRNDEAANWKSLLEDESFQQEVLERLVTKFPQVVQRLGQPIGAAAAGPSATPAATPNAEEVPKGAPVFKHEWYRWFPGGKMDPSTPGDVRREIETWQAEKRKFDENPNAYLEPLLQYRIKKGIEDAIKPLTEQQRKAEEDRKKQEQDSRAQEALYAKGQDALQRYSQYVLAYDDKGNPVTDSRGNHMLTQAGVAFDGFLQQALQRMKSGTRTLEGFDITDPEGRVEWAWKHTQDHFRRNPPKKPAGNGAPQGRLPDRPAGGSTRGAGFGGKADEQVLNGVSLDADGLHAALTRAVGKGT